MSGKAHDFLAAAQGYAERQRWSIIAIGKDKRPAIQRWTPYQSRRPSAAELAAMFRRGGVMGLALVCGEASEGATVRDFDIADRYRDWARRYADLAGLLPTSETGRGFHVFCTSNVRRIIKQADGELRGGGYTLLPPSQHPSGKPYRWIIPPGEALPYIDDLAGAGLVDLSRDRECPETESVQSGQRRRDGETAIDREDGKAIDGDPAPTGLVASAEFQSTIPKRSGQRNRKAFELARLLKSHHPDAKTPELRAIVQQWHKLALPYIGTKDFETTWGDFLNGWQSVRVPFGQGAETIMEQIPIDVSDAMLPPEARGYQSPDARRLVLLCAELQRRHKADPFYLSGAKAAEFLGVPPADADQKRMARLLSLVLTTDGILHLERKGNQRVANRYRFIAAMPSRQGGQR
ncbi:MAG: bifunctional DNA primase/polymerase [Planctomycetia bacterium]|nr:bifunctional DNA primase/polymerase [Planctomycetia bacterium]